MWIFGHGTYRKHIIERGTSNEQTCSFVAFRWERFARKNIGAGGLPTEIFAKIVQVFRLSNLRYPRGMQEGFGDLLKYATSNRLCQELVDFLDKVKTQNENSASFTVTLGILINPISQNSLARTS